MLVKTTIAKEFARDEYESYVKIDFSNISNQMLDIFKKIKTLYNK